MMDILLSIQSVKDVPMGWFAGPIRSRDEVFILEAASFAGKHI